MATHTGTNIKTELDVCLGKVGTPVGKLVFVRNGPRMFSQFAYFLSEQRPGLEHRAAGGECRVAMAHRRPIHRRWHDVAGTQRV